MRSVLREILRAEILVAIGFFAGCGVGGLLGGIAYFFALRISFGSGLAWFWGGQVVLFLIFAMLVRGRAVRAGAGYQPLPRVRSFHPSQSETAD